MASLTLFIKPTAGGDRLSVQIGPDSSVEQLKQAIQDQHSVPAAEQRLIYKGQVLKDEKSVKDYGRAWLVARSLLEAARRLSQVDAGLQNEHVLHMVRKPGAGSGGTPGGQRSQPAAAGGMPDLPQMVWVTR